MLSDLMDAGKGRNKDQTLGWTSYSNRRPPFLCNHKLLETGMFHFLEFCMSSYPLHHQCSLHRCILSLTISLIYIFEAQILLLKFLLDLFFQNPCIISHKVYSSNSDHLITSFAIHIMCHCPIYSFAKKNCQIYKAPVPPTLIHKCQILHGLSNDSIPW